MFSGDDVFFLFMYVVGAKGVIFVVGNVIFGFMSVIWWHCVVGQWD